MLLPQWTYRSLVLIGFTLLTVMILVVVAYGLARMAISDSHILTSPGDASRTGALGAHASPSGLAVVTGSAATALVFENDRLIAVIHGHGSPVVNASFVRGGRALVTIDTNGDVRLTDIYTVAGTHQFTGVAASMDIKDRFCTKYGMALAQLSLAALAHVRPLSFRDCYECPQMVVIPAGRFMMGSPQNEAERSSNEGPRHAVTIARPFAVGKFAVTRAEYAAFV